MALLTMSSLLLNKVRLLISRKARDGPRCLYAKCVSCLSVLGIFLLNGMDNWKAFERWIRRFLVYQLDVDKVSKGGLDCPGLALPALRG